MGHNPRRERSGNRVRGREFIEHAADSLRPVSDCAKLRHVSAPYALPPGIAGWEDGVRDLNLRKALD